MIIMLIDDDVDNFDDDEGDMIMIMIDDYYR